MEHLMMQPYRQKKVGAAISCSHANCFIAFIFGVACETGMDVYKES